MSWDYETAVKYIYDIPKFTKKGGIEQTEKLMAMLGNPQNDFKYIHIAGTNGKGSVSAFMAQALQMCGIKTGLFTSPHLVTINERLRIDGEVISNDDFVRLFEDIKQRVDAYVADGGVHPTFFEWMYMMAMCWFSRQKIQYAVVETGLGGRLDATNVIKYPELTLITSIGLDHVQYLGSDIASIAGEKAGIIKKDVSLVFDASVPEACAVICQRFGTVQGGADWRSRLQNEDAQGDACTLNTARVMPVTAKMMSETAKKVSETAKKVSETAKMVPVTAQMAEHVVFGDDRIDYDVVLDENPLHVVLTMNGTYQVDNSLIALHGLSLLGQNNGYFNLAKNEFYKRIVQGLESTVWAGRMEKVRYGFYIDGAHNDAGIRALVKTLNVHFKNKNIYLLFAVAEDKDYSHMIASLCALPNLQGVMVTAIDNVRRVDTKEVTALFEKNGHAPVKQSYNIKEALQTAMDWAGDNVLCCCGSLYLAGSVKEILA